jgi:uncharacterized protein YhaN
MAVSEIDHLTDEMERCVDSCFEAVQATEWCADQCTGSEEMQDCARLCRDVADLATQCGRFCSRESTFHTRTAELCADASEQCADECAKHDAEHCQVTEEKLRECADACREMVSAMS